MSARKLPRLFLGTESLAPGNGGICRLARLMSKVVAEEATAGRLEAEALVLSDRDVNCGIPLPVTVCSGSRLRFVTRTWRAALTHSHFLYDFVGMSRAHCELPLLRKPFLTWMCGIDVWKGTRPDRIARARAADLLLSISAYTRDRADRDFGGLSHARVCWLGTEADEAPAWQPDFGGRPTVLILGRMDPEPWKGHHALIDAWPRVIAAVPAARLVIVGGGQGKPAAMAHAAASSAAAHIEFRGFVPDDQIEAIWREATLYAMPGITEGFGLVYIEAMRQGLPVIASVHDAAPEINLDGQTGYNVNLQQPQQLADRIIDVLRNPDLAASLGKNSRQRWETHFRFSAFRARFLNLLRPWLG